MSWDRKTIFFINPHLMIGSFPYKENTTQCPIYWDCLTGNTKNTTKNYIQSQMSLKYK